METTQCQYCWIQDFLIKSLTSHYLSKKNFWKWDELQFDHLSEGPKWYGLPLCFFEFKLGICTTIYQ